MFFSNGRKKLDIVLSVLLIGAAAIALCGIMFYIFGFADETCLNSILEAVVPIVVLVAVIALTPVSEIGRRIRNRKS